MSEYVIERENIGPRVAVFPTTEGDQIVLMGTIFTSSCGCKVNFGVRFEDQDLICAYDPCDKHDATAVQFIERFSGPNTPEIDTELWMAQLLEALDKEQRDATRSH